MDELSNATISIPYFRITDSGKRGQWTSGEIISEQAVTIMIDQVGDFTLMCTPIDIPALAVGFAHTEGIIETIEDVIDIVPSKERSDLIGIKVEDPSQASIRRNMIVASSCGLCGVRTIERTLSDTKQVGMNLRIEADMLTNITDRLFDLQKIYPTTGGAHAAGVFTPQGNIIAFAEDIGRHNALDKVIGKCLIGGHPLKGFGIVLSSRASFEMISKAARSGVEIVAAASAPSSLAIHAAQKWNLTLCGPIRRGNALVHTHPQRIILAGEEIQLTRKNDS